MARFEVKGLSGGDLIGGDPEGFQVVVEERGMVTDKRFPNERIERDVKRAAIADALGELNLDERESLTSGEAKMVFGASLKYINKAFKK